MSICHSAIQTVSKWQAANCTTLSQARCLTLAHMLHILWKLLLCSYRCTQLVTQHACMALITFVGFSIKDEAAHVIAQVILTALTVLCQSGDGYALVRADSCKNNCIHNIYGMHWTQNTWQAFALQTHSVVVTPACLHLH